MVVDCLVRDRSVLAVAVDRPGDLLGRKLLKQFLADIGHQLGVGTLRSWCGVDTTLASECFGLQCGVGGPIEAVAGDLTADRGLVLADLQADGFVGIAFAEIEL